MFHYCIDDLGILHDDDSDDDFLSIFSILAIPFSGGVVVGFPMAASTVLWQAFCAARLCLLLGWACSLLAIHTIDV